jgi:hypothetical protein
MDFSKLYYCLILFILLPSCFFQPDNDKSNLEETIDKPSDINTEGDKGHVIYSGNPFIDDNLILQRFGKYDRDPFIKTYNHSQLSERQKDSIYNRFEVVFKESVSSKYLFGGVDEVLGTNRLGDTIRCSKKEYFSAIGLDENGEDFQDIVLLGGETQVPCLGGDSYFSLPYPAASIAINRTSEIAGIITTSQWGDGGDSYIDDKLYFISLIKCSEMLMIDVDSEGGIAYLPDFNAFLYDSNIHYTFVFPTKKVQFIKEVNRKQRFKESKLLTKIALDESLSIEEKLVNSGYVKTPLQ